VASWLARDDRSGTWASRERTPRPACHACRAAGPAGVVPAPRAHRRPPWEFGHLRAM